MLTNKPNCAAIKAEYMNYLKGQKAEWDLQAAVSPLSRISHPRLGQRAETPLKRMHTTLVRQSQAIELYQPLINPLLLSGGG